MDSPSQRPPHEALEDWLKTGLSDRWRWHSAEGAGLILLGIASLLAAPGGSPVFSGSILLLAGATTSLSVWRAEQYPGFALSLMLAVIAFTAGFHLLGAVPETALGFVFAAYFACRGAGTILLAVFYRRQRFSQWEWFAVSGVTSLILAMLILSGLPGPYTWMLGILLGVDLMFDGSALLALVLASNALSETAPAPALEEASLASLPGGPICEDSLHV